MEGPRRVQTMMSDMEIVEGRKNRDEVHMKREMQRDRLDAFARVIALSLRCHKVKFYIIPHLRTSRQTTHWR